jgi:ankyrin repeat protein
MYLKNTLLKFSFLFLSALISNTLFSQAKKPVPAAASKGSAKGTIAADMDCSVKINGAAKGIAVKAYSPLDVVLKVGENKIEALANDKKSTYRTTITAKAGEKPIIEVSFFEDGKFLDYVKSGNVNMVESALKKDPSLLNNENETLTASPLEIAIVNSQPELVKYLMNKGASFTKPENIYPLHKTILYVSSLKPAKDKPAPDLELTEFFLSKGCKLTDKDDGGNTPLLCAVRAGKSDLVAYLVEKGADINAKNDFDDTPLKMAQDKGQITIINYLKSKGALEK